VFNVNIFIGLYNFACLYQRRFKMVRSVGASFQTVTGIWPLNIKNVPF